MNSTLLIVGGAKCVWDDWMNITVENYDIMAINYTALFLGVPIHHIFSMHANILGPLRRFFYQDMGMGKKQPLMPVTHSCDSYDGVDEVWKFNLNGGSSGCYAAAVGVALGYDKIILCGCPADNTGNFYDPPWQDGFFKKCRPVWEFANEKYYEGKVFSMSGWTRKLLGGPE